MVTVAAHHNRSATLHCDQFMALLVHQQFAVDAFVALSSQAPDPVCTDGTVGSLLGEGRRREIIITNTLYSRRSYRSPAALQSKRSVSPSSRFTPSVNTKTNYLGPVGVSFSFNYSN